ncbi:MAG: hypothetical protein ABIR78_00815 [Ferruginibacter sp.]
MYNEAEILRDLKKQRTALEAELTKVNKAIFALEPMPVQSIGWKTKALSCLRNFNYYTQTVDILNCVFINEMQLLDNEIIRKRYITALSVALLDMVKRGELKMFKIYRVKGSFYGFPQWFDKDGLLKKEYYSERMKDMNKDLNGWLVTDKEAA